MEKATEAREKNEKSSIIEQIKLEIINSSLDTMGKIEQDNVYEILRKYGTIDLNKSVLITKDNKYEINLNDIWSDFNNENKYKGCKVSILGDSISTLKGYIPEGNRARYVQTAEEAVNGLIQISREETWWGRVIDSLEMELGINESWAGSRVSNTNTSNSGDLGPDRHMASMTRLGHLDDNGTPDVILFYGGTNDIGGSVTMGTFDSSATYATTLNTTSNTYSSFVEAYSITIKRMQYLYPNAEIICILPTYTTSYYNMTSLTNYNNEIKKICEFFNLKCIDLTQCGITTSNLVDGIHPSSEGMGLISSYIVDSITESGTKNLQDVWYTNLSMNGTYGVVMDGYGWALSETDVSDCIGHPVNIVKFKSNLSSGTLEIGKCIVNGSTATNVQTITWNSTNKSNGIVTIELENPITLNSGETFILFPNTKPEEGAFLFNIGITGSSFYSDAPTSRRNNTNWRLNTSGNLQFNFGYTNNTNISQTTWYTNSSMNGTYGVVMDGYGWALSETDVSDCIGHPVNIVKFKSNLSSGTLEIGKCIVNGSTATNVQTITWNSTNKSNGIVTIELENPITLNSGETFILFPNTKPEEGAFLFNIGITGSSFYSDAPTSRRNNTNWRLNTSGNLQFNFGYKN